MWAPRRPRGRSLRCLDHTLTNSVLGPSLPQLPAGPFNPWAAIPLQCEKVKIISGF